MGQLEDSSDGDGGCPSHSSTRFGLWAELECKSGFYIIATETSERTWFEITESGFSGNSPAASLQGLRVRTGMFVANGGVFVYI